MWKYFLKSLFNILKQVLFIVALSFIAMLSITLLSVIGPIAIIILVIAIFIYGVYEDAKRNYKRDRERDRTKISNEIENTLNLLYNPMLFTREDEYESLKNQFKKQVEEYKKEFGEDDRYQFFLCQYKSFLKREEDLKRYV